MKPSRPLTKLTIRMFEGQKEELESFYPRQGYNWAIREIVDQHLRYLRSKVKETEDDLPNLDLEP